MRSADIADNHDLVLEECFTERDLLEGRRYQANGYVLEFEEIESEDIWIEATVKNYNNQHYYVIIKPLEKIRGENVFASTCTCQQINRCCHAAAVMVDRQVRQQGEPDVEKQNSPELDRWLRDFGSMTKPESTNLIKAEKKNNSLLYLLEPKSSHGEIPTLTIKLVIARHLKNGGYGRPADYSYTSQSHQKCLYPDDDGLIFRLQNMCRKTKFDDNKNITFPLHLAKGSEILPDLIKTGRCILDIDISDKPLTLGKAKQLQTSWEMSANGNQDLKFHFDNNDIELYELEDFWYIDYQNTVCGPLGESVDKKILSHLLKIPSVPPQHVAKVTRQLVTLGLDQIIEMPEKIDEVVVRDDIAPKPMVRFDVIEEELPDFSYWSAEGIKKKMTPVAEVIFDYDGESFRGGLDNKVQERSHYKNGKLHVIQRDKIAERSYLDILFDLVPIEGAVHEKGKMLYSIRGLNNESDFFKFSGQIIPLLEDKGWHVELQDKSFATVINDEDLTWYSELDEQSSYDYFGLELGVIIDGEKVSLLPVVTEFLKQIPGKELQGIHKEESLLLPYTKGKILSVPYARLQPIINILVELFDTAPSEANEIKISKHHAALLIDIEKAFAASKLRWYGGSKIRELGRKLREFDAIKEVEIPKTFKAELRHYQQQGVNWLQFLREYEMGGILADDMGLGKTVQTLAHLAVEKSKQRMQQPSLIVAPTSLMTNWRHEVNKFTPNLKVLVFHGDERHQHANDFSDYDIIVTSYSLLARDQALLLKTEFYYVILDEAQFIKNSKAKKTQIVQQLQAKHRLCLTGTPMENHLGELWSLFNFLMPGILGESRQFTRLFRTPIEKHNDNERRKGLTARTRPFLLRRLKSQVVKELPDKTEIIHTVELEGPQRDLYESIRLSMEKKVRDAIREKGLARSHIVILDALLKLRQTCCDPRLLKLPSANKAHKHSAKMDLLKELLPSMVEEGRKIIIFSQFTTMLGLIQDYLDKEDFDYVKLTGSTKDREKPLTAFQEGDVPIFLVSLKAGGTGLNLTAADTVILYDPWWNPAVEDQAVDRAHRIGQDKSVFVYKLISEGTVEETIQEMQLKKRELMQGLLSEKHGSKLDLSQDDLMNLFKPLD